MGIQEAGNRYFLLRHGLKKAADPRDSGFLVLGG
jgi:hypothetical protein